jgi:hypothetical protein
VPVTIPAAIGVEHCAVSFVQFCKVRTCAHISAPKDGEDPLRLPLSPHLQMIDLENGKPGSNR